MTHIDYVSMTCSIPYVRQIILKAIYQVSLIKIIPIWITFLLPYHWLRGIANARSFSYWHGKSDHILSLHRKLCVCVCVCVCVFNIKFNVFKKSFTLSYPSNILLLSLCARLVDQTAFVSSILPPVSWPVLALYGKHMALCVEYIPRGCFIDVVVLIK